MKVSNFPVLPEDYNYIAAFLTFRCQLRCPYCINRINELKKCAEIDGKTWVKIINRIDTLDIPITIGGGEPTLHKDFYYIVNNLREDIHIDLLTNLQFDINVFMQHIHPERLRRNSPYASIRVSYHPITVNYDELKVKTMRMLDKGYYIGIWAVNHPTYEAQIQEVKEDAVKSGIDFRVKPFLGFHNDRLYGEYVYSDAICKLHEKEELEQKEVLCRTTELLMAPDGTVYNCHHDLYTGCNPIGNIANDDLYTIGEYRRCTKYGYCNPCDIKIKFNRFQEWGHCSVDIKVV